MPLLPRLNHRHGLTAAEIDDLVDVLSIQAEVIEPLPRAKPDLRDPDDPPVLGTLLAALKTSGAVYLVAGDKDLLAMADRYPIVTPAKFWATHAGL
jgi:predicted nucleic acid-binding protein